MTSTKYSRRLVVIGTAETIPAVRVLGLPPFRVDPPFHAEPGTYRADLDPNTGTATIREEAS